MGTTEIPRGNSGERRNELDGGQLSPILQNVTGQLSSQPTTREELEHAIDLFVAESNEYDVPLDEDGFYNQTARSIVQRGLQGVGGDLWLALEGTKVVAFALTHMTSDVDDKPCFWITCAYVAHGYRSGIHLVEWYGTLQDEAKARGAKHIILPSSRSIRAYMRRLKGFHPYVTLLKKDL